MEGDAVKSKAPPFFESDSRPRWRAAVAGCWIWIRLKIRHNPGFMTAAVAGSLGLMLCLAMLVGSDDDATALSSDDGNTAVELGAPGEGEDPFVAFDEPRRGWDAEGADMNGAPGRARLAAQRSRGDFGNEFDSGRNERRSRDADTTREADEPDDDPFLGLPRGKPAGIAKSTPPRRAFDAVDDDPAPIRRPLNRFQENTLADPDPADLEPATEPEIKPAARPARITFTPNADVAEPAAPDEEPVADDRETLPVRPRTLTDVARDNKEQPDLAEPAETVAENPPVRRLPRAAVIEPDEPQTIAEEPPVRKTPPARVPLQEPTVDAEETPADVSPKPESRPAPAWKNSPEKPRPARPAPPVPFAEESDDVQTTIHAAPVAPERRSAVEPAAAEVKQPASPVRLEIRAPRTALAGQTIEIELLVINTGNAPVRDALLSVALPAGLTHPLGPELERPIALLGPRELKRVRLAVKAVANGPFDLTADVAIAGRIGSKVSATIGGTRSSRMSSVPVR